MMTKGTSSILKRKQRLGGAISGYILLAATAIFLLNVLYQVVEFQVLDAIAAAMIGVVAIYSVIAVWVIAAFSSRTVVAEAALDVSAETNHLGAGGNHDNPGRPDLRLLQADSFESAGQSERQRHEGERRNSSGRAA